MSSTTLSPCDNVKSGFSTLFLIASRKLVPASNIFDVLIFMPCSILLLFLANAIAAAATVVAFDLAHSRPPTWPLLQINICTCFQYLLCHPPSIAPHFHLPLSSIFRIISRSPLSHWFIQYDRSQYYLLWHSKHPHRLLLQTHGRLFNSIHLIRHDCLHFCSVLML